MSLVLTYNCGTWALTKTEEEKLDSFHRKQLRKILGIKYPVIITNKSLYQKCNETPLSLQILESRWRLFGHILRRDESIPANKAMQFYFKKSENSYLGRPLTSLPITLNNDLSKLKNNTLKLRTTKDLENLRRTARNRRCWKIMTRNLMEAAKASRSDD